MKDRTQKICGRLVRDGNAAVGCSPMRTDARSGECYCGNYVGLFVLPNLSRLTTSRTDFFGMITS